jgi:hypothetical protein
MVSLGVCLGLAIAVAHPPIRLHPTNPHYLEFRGKPSVLVTSGEHYGAVLNLDFDHAAYLDELKAHGFNLTRTFSGAYFEVPGNFKIKDNTLAPAPGRNIAPWPKKGDKYDLDSWDDAYFRRLKSFVTEAGARGIVVEYVLFCPFYEDSMWSVSPMNARNNLQGVGNCPREEAYTIKHPKLLAKQLAFVAKATQELRDFDNVYLEVCNEPYFGGVTMDWQRKVVDAIVESEKDVAHKHMIAQNIANGSPKIENPDPRVSIFNLHYAAGLGDNYRVNKAIGDDETGFKGVADRAYRAEAWEFLLDGGAVYSNLDYSFTTAHEDGSAAVTEPTPGGGGTKLRAQLAFLKKFVEDLPLVAMKPARLIFAGPWDDKVKGLGDPGRAYVFYKNGGGSLDLSLDLPAGSYHIEWIEPATGRVVKVEDKDSGSKPPSDKHNTRARLESPKFAEDIAVRITARAQ